MREANFCAVDDTVAETADNRQQPAVMRAGAVAFEVDDLVHFGGSKSAV